MLTSLKAAGGVVTVHSRQRTLTDVTVKGPQHEPRHLLLEVARTAGTVPPDFLAPTEETEAVRRFAIDLKPAETRRVTLAVDDLQSNSVAFEDSPDAIVDILNNQLLGERARQALSHILDLRLEQTEKTTARDRLTKQSETIENDETRLRSNLAATQPGDALHARLIRALDQDETRMSQTASAIEAANGAIAAAHKALTDAIGALDL